ncbi:hypothetical protein ABZZ17_18545 [Streptomyces sp. NPDC006512]|uniref:hypothetical protein n=1 Tax=Streptomyces sp. NPDC006512 TaxID=3154307 RepID=UPI0033B06273
MSDEPRVAPFNADDLKQEHAKSLIEYLDQIWKTLAEKHAADSFEGRAARTLREAVGIHQDALNECFDDEEPETLEARKQAWNRLVWLVWPWEGTPGYDARQWRLVHHVDADDAVEGARQLLASREAIAQKRRAELEAL